MFFNKKNPNFDVIIGAKATIKGDIETEGSVCIEGKVNGNIHTDGYVIVSQHSNVTGNIKAHSANIYGTCLGDIETTESITVNATAVLKGNAKCGSIATIPGCEFSGSLTVTPAPAVQQKSKTLSTKVPGFTKDDAGDHRKNDKKSSESLKLSGEPDQTKKYNRN